MKIFFSFSLAFGLTLALAVSSAHAANEAQTSELEALSVVPLQYAIPGHLSSSERSWFKTFQEGNLVSDGWQKISADILTRTPEKDRPAQKAALASLGMKIGLDWCRSNSERKVTTSMLREWGDILKKTADKNPHQLRQVIARIDQEVDNVLH